MLELTNLKKASAGVDAQAVGIEALNFIAEDPKLFQRFLDLSGLEVGQLRAEAAKPAFFVGLLDFILAYEPTTMDFANRAGLDPAAVQVARDKLAPVEPDTNFD
ncbi:DUF3572 domain-containing protein [Antarcticirhabdus aurantiaca]|uniref:DUF3572 domain-containing protein n=1 Tax=Antarcticirhabdus aurantiaca TaxID=2606717 RepID=A0ACD4NW91_9HYPH|nr:DUF3572 domain-containing protein [Antarcticirhabdus aurantiaca]WAJ31185.1 DUF3572 domain-containing protein [Jeongeuplla avenae]